MIDYETGKEPAQPADWPALPLAEWADTYATLHMWTQIAGKTRLALAPAVNHWWHVPLYVTARGLSTGRMPYGSRGIEVAFDFITHEVTADADDGRRWSLPLEPRSVAEFYARYLEGLRSLDVTVPLWPHPVEVPDPIPFAEDEQHGAYDAEAAHRFWRALAQADRVLNVFRGSFIGKCSPVHFFWGSFDLACTRFSGRRAPEHPGGVPNMADWVTREAYSHECASAGWWPGSAGSPVAEPAFYAYAYPAPEGYGDASVEPTAARWEAALGEWVLPYEAARTSTDPDAAVLAFLRSSYEAVADLAGWDRTSLERQPAAPAVRRMP